MSEKIAWWIKKGVPNPGLKAGKNSRFKNGNIPWWKKEGKENPAITIAKKRNPNYKENRKYRDNLETTKEYKQWRLFVLKRDNYKCQICKVNKKLECHHIIPISHTTKLETDTNNGITLCQACHRKTYNKEIEFGKKQGWILEEVPW